MSQESLAFTRAADILVPSLFHTHSFCNELYLLTAPSTMRSSGTHTTSSLSSISSWWCTCSGTFQAFYICLHCLPFPDCKVSSVPVHKGMFGVDVVPAFWFFFRGVLKYQTNIEAHPPGCVTANQSSWDPQAKEVDKADNEERPCREEAHFQGHYPQVCLLSSSLYLIVAISWSATDMCAASSTRDNVLACGH